MGRMVLARHTRARSRPAATYNHDDGGAPLPHGQGCHHSTNDGNKDCRRDAPISARGGQFVMQCAGGSGCMLGQTWRTHVFFLGKVQNT